MTEKKRGYKEEKKRERMHRHYAYRAAIILLMVGIVAILGMKYISGENRKESLELEDETAQKLGNYDSSEVVACVINKKWGNNKGIITLQVESDKETALPAVVDCEVDEDLFLRLSKGDRGTFKLQNANGTYQIIGKQ